MQMPSNLQGMPSEIDLDHYLDSFLTSMHQDGRGGVNLHAGVAGASGNLLSAPGFQRTLADSQNNPNSNPNANSSSLNALGGAYPLALGYFPGSNPLQFGLFNSQQQQQQQQQLPGGGSSGGIAAQLAAFQSSVPSLSLPRSQHSAQLQAQDALLLAQQHAGAAASRNSLPVGGSLGMGSRFAGGSLGMGSLGMGSLSSQALSQQLLSMPPPPSQQASQQRQQQWQPQQAQPAPSQPPATKKRGARAAAAAAQKADEASSGDHSSGSDLDSSDEVAGGGGGGGGGGQKPRKRRELMPDEAERRHEKLQEKNRRAQRRFRERQKVKLTELHQQIQELAGKVGSLQQENGALHSRTSILEKVLDMRNEQIQVMQESKEKRNHETEASGLQGVGGTLVQLSPEVVKELTAEQIYKIYQTYVKELSVRLAEMESLGPEGDTPARQQELEQLVKDLTMTTMRLGVIKPLESRKFIMMSRQYLGNTEAEVLEMWQGVMRAVGLPDAGMREIVNLKRMFLQRIEPIMEERKRLNVQIQNNLPLDTFHTKNALTYIKAHEAVIKLRDNLRAEQHIVLEFTIAVFRGVFKSKQMATLLVKSYPAVPDALGIASALAHELGQPEGEKAVQLAMQLGGYTLQGAPGRAPNLLTLGDGAAPAGSMFANSSLSLLEGGLDALLGNAPPPSLFVSQGGEGVGVEARREAEGGPQSA